MRFRTLPLIAALAAVSSPAFAQDPTKDAPPPASPTAPDAAEAPAPVDLKKVSYAIGVQLGRGLRRMPEYNMDDYLQGIADGYAGTKSASYAQGMSIGNNLKEGGFPFDMESIKAAVSASVNNEQLSMTDEEIQAAMQAWQQEIARQRQEERAAAGKENAAKGKAFLEENKTKEGVKVTESGLQYKVVAPPADKEAPKPSRYDQVEVRYRGTLIDGTEFDASGDSPTRFRVTGVIPGWTEALLDMQKGEKRQLFIPAELAYQEQSPSPKIGPNSTLIFDVELVNIISPPTAVTPPVSVPVVPRDKPQSPQTPPKPEKKP